MQKREIIFVYLPNTSHFMHFQSVRQKKGNIHNKTNKYRWHFRSKPHQTTSLRLYVRRKSDLLRLLVKFDPTLFILNDNVNTKSFWLNILTDVCLWYCGETTWMMCQTVLYWEVNKVAMQSQSDVMALLIWHHTKRVFSLAIKIR